MRKLLAIFSVLRRGRELGSAATWKTVGAATAALAIVLPDVLKLLCLATGVCIDLTPGEINEVAAGMANVGVGLFVLYTIFGTSKKVGL